MNGRTLALRSVGAAFLMGTVLGVVHLAKCVSADALRPMARLE